MKYILGIILSIAIAISSSATAIANNKTTTMSYISDNTLQTLSEIQLQATAINIPTNNIGNLINFVALQLVGKPYATHLLDRAAPEYLYISTEQTDCMLFVENVVAIASMIQTQAMNQDNYANLIAKIRYHGPINYCNRNHYFTDWANNGIQLGMFRNITIPNSSSTLPKRFGVLSQYIQESGNIHNTPEFINCIRLREHYLESINLGMVTLPQLQKNKGLLHNGDIIGLVRDVPNVDVTHMGIVSIDQNGNIGLINASLTHKKVVYEKNLINYLQNTKKLQGIVVLRATNQN